MMLARSQTPDLSDIREACAIVGEGEVAKWILGEVMASNAAGIELSESKLPEHQSS